MLGPILARGEIKFLRRHAECDSSFKILTNIHQHFKEDRKFLNLKFTP